MYEFRKLPLSLLSDNIVSKYKKFISHALIFGLSSISLDILMPAGHSPKERYISLFAALIMKLNYLNHILACEVLHKQGISFRDFRTYYSN